MLRVCHDLSCWLRGADDRLAADPGTVRAGHRRRAGRGVLHRPVRRRAGRRGQRGPGDAGRGGRPGRRGPRRRSAARGGAARRRPASGPAVAQRSVRLGGGALRGPAGRARRRPARPARSPRRWPTAGCAAWAAPGSPPAGSGSWSRRRSRRRSTPSATRMSPSPGRSRTGRSWPTSRTWCSRACCSGCSRPGPRKAGCSSGTSTARRRRWSAGRSSGCALLD